MKKHFTARDAHKTKKAAVYVVMKNVRFFPGLYEMCFSTLATARNSDRFVLFHV